MKAEETSFFTQAIEALKQDFLANPFLDIIYILLIMILLLVFLFLLGAICRKEDDPILRGVHNVLQGVCLVIIVVIAILWAYHQKFLVILVIGGVVGFYCYLLWSYIPVSWKNKLFKRKNKDTDNKS